MNRKLVIAVAVLALVAVGAGYFAWSASGDLDRLHRELNTTKTQGDRSRAELLAARTELDKANKELASLKIAAAQAMTERDSVRKFLEAEQATGVQLRQDLAAAKAQISALSAKLRR